MDQPARPSVLEFSKWPLEKVAISSLGSSQPDQTWISQIWQDSYPLILGKPSIGPQIHMKQQRICILRGYVMKLRSVWEDSDRMWEMTGVEVKVKVLL